MLQLMPACISCKELVFEQKICSSAHHKPLRSCISPIVNEYHSLLLRKSRVLEIGCGAWSPSKHYCEQNEIVWEGIDVSETYMGKRTIATKIASVGALPFKNEYFDFVIGNQTLEHWEENNVPLRKGLSEVFRVLKPSGVALFNVPIHFHGHYLFIEGNLESIRNLLLPYCSEVRLEPWRKPAFPLTEITHLKKLFRHRPELAGSHAYILDIRARKMDVGAAYFDDKAKSSIVRLIEGLRLKGFQYYKQLVWDKVLIAFSGYFSK